MISACVFPSRRSEVNVVSASPVLPSHTVARRALTVTNLWRGNLENVALKHISGSIGHSAMSIVAGSKRNMLHESCRRCLAAGESTVSGIEGFILVSTNGCTYIAVDTANLNFSNPSLSCVRRGLTTSGCWRSHKVPCSPPEQIEVILVTPVLSTLAASFCVTYVYLEVGAELSLDERFMHLFLHTGVELEPTRIRHAGYQEKWMTLCLRYHNHARNQLLSLI